MTFENLLEKLGIAKTYRKSAQEEERVLNEQHLKACKAYEELNSFFNIELGEETPSEDSPEKLGKILEGMKDITKYVEYKKNDLEGLAKKAEEKVTKHYTVLGEKGGLSLKKGFKLLQKYFGEPRVQEAQYPASPAVFSELEILQASLEHDKWNMGSEGLVIMAGQSAFLKREDDMVRVAIYKPFDCEKGVSSVWMYEYNEKNLMNAEKKPELHKETK